MITLDLQHASATSYSIIHIIKLPLPSTAKSLELLSLFTYLPTFVTNIFALQQKEQENLMLGAVETITPEI